MLKSISAPFATTIVSIGAITIATMAGCVAVFSSGVPAATAAAQIPVATYQSPPSSDRVAVLVKGTACSSLGWPNYEEGCQFDMRRPAEETRPVRVIALR
jgi:hypothetical protein